MHCVRWIRVSWFIAFVSTSIEVDVRGSASGGMELYSIYDGFLAYQKIYGGFLLTSFLFQFLSICHSLCSDIRNWIRNIEQHASDNVNKILVGNKADMDESKRVSVYEFYFNFLFGVTEWWCFCNYLPGYFYFFNLVSLIVHSWF